MGPKKVFVQEKFQHIRVFRYGQCSDKEWDWPFFQMNTAHILFWANTFFTRREDRGVKWADLADLFIILFDSLWFIVSPAWWWGARRGWGTWCGSTSSPGGHAGDTPAAGRTCSRAHVCLVCYWRTCFFDEALEREEWKRKFFKLILIDTKTICSWLLNLSLKLFKIIFVESWKLVQVNYLLILGNEVTCNFLNFKVYFSKIQHITCV